MNLQLRLLACFLAVVVSVALAGFFIVRPGPPATASALIVAASQEPDTFFPMFRDMMITTEISGAIFRDLSTFDDRWQLIPVMAKEIPSVENGQWQLLEEGKMRTVWRIREEACWEDGVPVTADDFIFGQEVMMHPDLPVLTRDVARRIETMRAPDPKTIEIVWKEPFAYANVGDNHYFLPKHLLERAFRDNPANFLNDAFSHSPVGNGPFRLTEWKSGSYIRLEANPKFWGPKPAAQTIIYSVVPNTTTAMRQIQSEQIAALSAVSISFEEALDLKHQSGDGVNVHLVPGLTWEHIDFNLDSPILADKRVRQALVYGIDRQGLVDTLFEGKQEVSHSWLPPRHYAYNPNLKKYAYEPARAATLLDEAGWVLGPDRVRVNAMGERLSLEFMTTADAKTREKVQQFLQEDWRKIGVEVEIRNQPGKVFFGETMRRRLSKHLAMYAWVQSPVADGESLWTIANIPSESNTWQGQNNPGWRNPEIDEIDHLVPQTLSQEERRKLLWREQDIWVEELPVIPLYFRVEVSATRPNFQNWRPTGTQYPLTWNCEAWQLAQ